MRICITKSFFRSASDKTRASKPASDTSNFLESFAGFSYRHPIFVRGRRASLQGIVLASISLKVEKEGESFSVQRKGPFWIGWTGASFAPLRCGLTGTTGAGGVIWM